MRRRRVAARRRASSPLLSLRERLVAPVPPAARQQEPIGAAEPQSSLERTVDLCKARGVVNRVGAGSADSSVDRYRETRDPVTPEPSSSIAVGRGARQDLQGIPSVGRSHALRVLGHVPAGRRSAPAARVPGDPPRPGPSTSLHSLQRFHRPRPYCAGGERSTPFIPEGRRQRVAPGESQSGGARAVTEVESGIGEASCLLRSLRHGLRSARVPGSLRIPAPDFSAHALRV
jgi:hypothetical protein